MQDLEGKTAVVTGAASGIGLATAHRLGREGMNLVLADIEEQPLSEAVAALEDDDVEVIGHRADVSDIDAVRELQRVADERFGPVHLLFNNAGVGGGGMMLEPDDLEVWEWVVGIDLWGVLYGIKVFGPAMVALRCRNRPRPAPCVTPCASATSG